MASYLDPHGRALDNLDKERILSMADEGGVSAATMEGKKTPRKKDKNILAKVEKWSQVAVPAIAGIGMIYLLRNLVLDVLSSRKT